MNWLAHLYLSEKDEEILIGNLLGDFYVKKEFDGYSKKIQAGIKFHFKIDAFTDRHPAFIRSKRRMSRKNRRLSGIATDIFYDHFLSIHWSQYAEYDLTRFISSFYKTLESHRSVLPGKLSKILPRMIQENWLYSYSTIEGIADILKRTSKRLSFTNNLSDEIVTLRQNHTEFEKDFSSFFPEVIRYANSLKSKPETVRET